MRESNEVMTFRVIRLKISELHISSITLRARTLINLSNVWPTFCFSSHARRMIKVSLHYSHALNRVTLFPLMQFSTEKTQDYISKLVF
jgi:hypothetical protein